MGTTQNNVVIAGVGPGLGAALARKFANHGCNIGLLARNKSYLDQLVDQMAHDGQTALALPTDLADAVQIESAFQQFTDTLGTVDILINHTSGAFWKSVMEISAEEFEISWRNGTLKRLALQSESDTRHVEERGGQHYFHWCHLCYPGSKRGG